MSSIRQITIEYDFGKVVYQRCDDMQEPKVVTGILLEPGAVKYRCHGAYGEEWFYHFELSGEPTSSSLN